MRVVIKLNLQEAAKSFMIPVDKNGNISPMYADRYTDTYYKKKYGEKAWQDACTKARTEYNFGSNAVRW